MRTMLKFVIASFVIVMAIGDAYAQDKKLEKAEEKFCNDLQGMADALIKLDDMNENSSMDEFRSAYNDAQKAWNKLEKSAEKLEKVEMKESQKAYNKLVKSIDDIEGDVKTSEAADQIDDNIDATASQISDILTTVCQVDIN